LLTLGIVTLRIVELSDVLFPEKKTIKRSPFLFPEVFFWIFADLFSTVPPTIRGALGEDHFSGFWDSWRVSAAAFICTLVRELVLDDSFVTFSDPIILVEIVSVSIGVAVVSRLIPLVTRIRLLCCKILPLVRVWVNIAC